MKPDTKYNFGEAIQALKFGLAIRRSGWNGKNLMVFKQVPAYIEGSIIPKCNRSHRAQRFDRQGKQLYRLHKSVSYL